MELDGAKLEFFGLKVAELSNTVDTLMSTIKASNEASLKMSQAREQSILNSIQPAVEKATDSIEKNMDRMLGAYLERMHSCTDAQDKSIDSMISLIETMRISVDGHGNIIKEIKREQEEIKETLTDPDTGVIPRIINLENRPGRNAIKAWQWMAAGGVSAAGVAFGIVSWILSH